jgi:hydrogenase/urease accessory protein HupE
MIRAFCFLLVWLGTLAVGHGHSMMTAYLDLAESPDGSTVVVWRRPVFPGNIATIEPVFPAGVTRVFSNPIRDEGVFTREQFVVRGAPKLWSDCRISMHGNAPGGLEVLIRVELADGQKHVAVLRTAADSFTVPAHPGKWQAAGSYFRLGLDHILQGVDHLLFVLGLLILVPGRMTLVKTITAFTIAHSITLGIATLGYAHAPLPPLNLAIALSIFFLAPEIIRKQRGQSSLTIQRPWLVVFVFGLLHGFGFASGLTALGLPRTEVPFALLLFNLGVEFGQLCFVFLILALVRSFRTLEINWPRWMLDLPCYTVGGLGAFWTVQRAVLLIRALP